MSSNEESFKKFRRDFEKIFKKKDTERYRTDIEPNFKRRNSTSVLNNKPVISNNNSSSTSILDISDSSISISSKRNSFSNVDLELMTASNTEINKFISHSDPVLNKKPKKIDRKINNLSIDTIHDICFILNNSVKTPVFYFSLIDNKRCIIVNDKNRNKNIDDFLINSSGNLLNFQHKNNKIIIHKINTKYLGGKKITFSDDI